VPFTPSTKDNQFPRGSEWRIWDLHVHSPASFEWKGQRLRDMNSDEQRSSMDQMIKAMNTSKPAVFALMDYWTFDGWHALNERLKETGAPQLNKKYFPELSFDLFLHLLEGSMRTCFSRTK
jgi:hypothetical protein